MEGVATSVRITAAANALLTALAGKTGKPKSQILEEALRDWEERTFWADVQRAFAAGPEADELRAERELWDRTASDGFSPVEAPPPARRPRPSELEPQLGAKAGLKPRLKLGSGK